MWLWCRIVERQPSNDIASSLELKLLRYDFRESSGIL
jgi:hypothetical protein